MKNSLYLKQINWTGFITLLIPLLLFWIIVLTRVPYSFSQYFHTYSLGLFLIVVVIYYLSYQLPNKFQPLVCLGITLILFALTLSFKWTSGYSDNKVIAGMLPYKDGAGYYFGANLILNGLPLENTVQAGWRPLFPGFLSSMLFLMGGNLKLVLAVLVLLAGIGAYCASHQIFMSWGALPAGLYSTFLYFYIQPLLGLTMTELLGFTIGCFAFSLLWITSYSLKFSDFILGLLALILALSVRAGTFFILPLLAIWSGRIFGGKEKFSLKVSLLAILVILLAYFFFNSIFAHLVGVPEDTVFGNFSYSLYGQVHGGTGWHRAIEELGTVKPDIVYKAAFQFFLAHPLSLFIGIAKSYRDFFLPGDGSIFAFNMNQRIPWADYMSWGLIMILIVYGVFISIKRLRSSVYALLVAGFVGIILSIPFLPPIDGGGRFYASTIPFFFAIPMVVLGNNQRILERDQAAKPSLPDRKFMHVGIIFFLSLTVFIPLFIYGLETSPLFTVPVCSAEQVPFAIEFHPESYVDLVSESNNCGLMPAICLSDFEKNGVEKTVDDFYQSLYSTAINNATDDRIFLALDFVDKRSRYFDFPMIESSNWPSSGLLTGCAMEIKTKNQTIYQVESFVFHAK